VERVRSSRPLRCGSEQARIGRPGCHRRRPDRDRPASLRWGSAPVAIRSCGTPAGHRDGEPDETPSTRRACYAVNTSHRRARSRRSSQHESGDAHLSRGARVPAVRGRRCQSGRGPLAHSLSTFRQFHLFDKCGTGVTCGFGSGDLRWGDASGLCRGPSRGDFVDA
jgi:hypothetical protein